MTDRDGITPLNAHRLVMAMKVAWLGMVLASCAAGVADGAGELVAPLDKIAACAGEGIAPAQCPGVPVAQLRSDPHGNVQVDVHYPCDGAQPTAEVARAGLQISSQVHTPPLCVIEGWIAPGALHDLARATHVSSVSLPVYGRPRSRDLNNEERKDGT